MKQQITFGSVCSGIEAAQIAFNALKFKQLWSSEIAEFPCKVLDFHYPDIPNIGDMNSLPELILNGKQPAPDILCGGTPCQAFSLAGWKQGLEDERGQLTLTFIKIANAIDNIRAKENKNPAIVLWENVEGVLNDKTNAFGNFIAGLAGYDEEIKINKWTKSGFIKGEKRNVAWRVIDAKYFGLAQQRRRLYVLAGGVDFRPDQLLFEFDNKNTIKYLTTTQPKKQKKKETIIFDYADEPTINKDIEQITYKNGEKFEFFRKYTDCLYSAYGTKWNGNAAAYNGSLYIAQNEMIRRFTPLECERLMGIPDNYTLVNGCSDTNRYQAVGNSWAIPVIRWIGQQIKDYMIYGHTQITEWTKYFFSAKNNINATIYLLDKDIYQMGQELFLNTSSIRNNPIEGNLFDVVQIETTPKKFYLTPLACKGILRRKYERNIKMNPKLEKLMTIISQQ